MNNRMDSFRRALTAMAAVGIMVGLVIYGFTHDNFHIVTFALIAAPLVAMINHPHAWVIGVIGLLNSQIIVPGLPNGLTLVHLLMGGFIGLIVCRNIITKPGRMPSLPVLSCVWLYLLVLVVIISQRGLGFMAVGSSSIGGTFYIKIFLCAGFLFCSRYVQLTAKQWRLTIILLVGSSFLPIFAQLLYIASGGSFVAHYKVIQPYVAGLKETLTALNTETGVVRFEALASVASNIMLFALAFTARGHRMRGTTFLLLGACLLGFALSGFRGGIIEFVVTLGLYLFLAAPRAARAAVVLRLGFISLFGAVLLIPLMEHMPGAIQRSFSFLPFVEVQQDVMASAEASTQWRLDLWRYLSGFIPDYLWLGRGFTVEIADLMSWSVSRDVLLLYYATHDYHNGPLSLLLDTGLPGTLAAILFMILGAREVLKPQAAKEILTSGVDPFLARFYTVAQAMFLYQVFKFFFLFGDARDSFSTMFLTLAIVLGLRRTHRAAAAKADMNSKRIIDPTFGGGFGHG